MLPVTRSQKSFFSSLPWTGRKGTLTPMAFAMYFSLRVRSMSASFTSSIACTAAPSCSVCKGTVPNFSAVRA